MEKSFIDSALRGWKFNVEQAEELFGAYRQSNWSKRLLQGKTV